MIRKITPSDKELYLKLTDEFYKSDAVMHRIDSENFELTWQELMRSGDYTECFIIEKDGETAGYMLLAYTFSRITTSGLKYKVSPTINPKPTCPMILKRPCSPSLSFLNTFI